MTSEHLGPANASVDGELGRRDPNDGAICLVHLKHIFDKGSSNLVPV